MFVFLHMFSMVAISMRQLDERKRTPEVGGRTQDVRLLGSRRFHGVLYGFTVVSQYFFIWKSLM